MRTAHCLVKLACHYSAYVYVFGEHGTEGRGWIPSLDKQQNLARSPSLKVVLTALYCIIFFRDFCHSCVFTEDMVRIKMIWDRFLPHRNTFTSSLFPLRCTLLNIYKRTEIIESWWCRSQLWPWDQECHWSWALAARMAIQSYSDWSPLFDDKQFLQSLPLWISTSCTFVTRSQPSGREFSGLQLRAWFSLTIPWPIL